MSRYPDLASCGVRFIHLSFHVSGGLEAIDAFWEERGLDRSRERLLFAGYSRDGRRHTIYLQWMRSHEGCCDVYIGIEARKPAEVWPRRPSKAYKLRETDFRDFLHFLRGTRVYGIRVRYGYPWDGNPDHTIGSLPNVRLRTLAFDVLDKGGRAEMTFSYERRGNQWLVIVEPADLFPFPEGDDFFFEPYQTACTLQKSLILKQELPS